MILGDAVILGSGGETASILAIGDVLATDTVYAEKGGKRINGVWKREVNPVWLNLPSAYQQVEFIESHGTEYIDIGIVPNTSHRFVLDAAYTDLTFNNQQGSSPSSGAPKCTFLATISGSVNTFMFGIGNEERTSVPSDTNRHIFINDLENGECWIDGNRVLSVSTAGFSSTYSFYLFARTTLSFYAKEKLYQFSVYSNNMLVRNMIPCYRIADNAIGLYDTVNNVFYTNQGTGTFDKGKSVYETIDGFLCDKIGSYGTWEVTAKRAGRTDFFTLVRVDAAEQFTVEVSA